MNVRYVCMVRMYRESGWVNKLLKQVYWYAMCCVCIDVYVGKSMMGMDFCGNQDGERTGRRGRYESTEQTDKQQDG